MRTPHLFPRVTPHDLRHAAGLLAISAGGNVKAEVGGFDAAIRGGQVGKDLTSSMRLSPPLLELQKLAASSQAVAPGAVEVEPQPWAVRRRLADAQIEEMVTKYQSGAGTPELCDELRISKPSMRELLHERGVGMRRQPLKKTQRAEAVRRYKFANARGGYIIFGITDNPRRAVGLSDRAWQSFDNLDQETLEFLNAALSREDVHDTAVLANAN